MKKTLLLGLCLLPLYSPESRADDFVTVSIGAYDVQDKREADLRVEYRPDIKLLLEDLKPYAGLEATNEGTLWGGGGILYDWNVAEKYYITPSFGAGLYTQGSSDIDLDNAIILRTQIEASYELLTKDRISVSLSHLSNGGMGDHNPGTEVLSVGYSFAFN